jgi:hypothetical protein
MITRERERRCAVGKACQRGEDPGQLCLVARLRGLASVDVVEHQADPLAVVERSPQPRSGNCARKVRRDNGLAAVETRFDRPVIADRLGEHSSPVRQPEPRRRSGREAARLAAGGHHLAARDCFDLLTSRRRQFVPNKGPHLTSQASRCATRPAVVSSTTAPVPTSSGALRTAEPAYEATATTNAARPADFVFGSADVAGWHVWRTGAQWQANADSHLTHIRRRANLWTKARGRQRPSRPASWRCR